MRFGVETHVDFVLTLDNVSLNRLMLLNDPADVVCDGAVSRLWRQFDLINEVHMVSKNVGKSCSTILPASFICFRFMPVDLVAFCTFHQKHEKYRQTKDSHR
ncbi:hypothetical protein P3L10_001404 [Capsicum annuum]